MPAHPGNSPTERIVKMLEEFEQFEAYAAELRDRLALALTGAQMLQVPSPPEARAIKDEMVRMKFTRKRNEDMRGRMARIRLAGQEFNIPRPTGLGQLRTAEETIFNMSDEEAEAALIAEGWTRGPTGSLVAPKPNTNLVGDPIATRDPKDFVPGGKDGKYSTSK